MKPGRANPRSSLLEQEGVDKLARKGGDRYGTADFSQAFGHGSDSTFYLLKGLQLLIFPGVNSKIRVSVDLVF